MRYLTNLKSLTKAILFRQQNFTGFIQRCLDYIFAQNFQDIAKHIEILNVIGTGDAPVLCSFQILNQC